MMSKLALGWVDCGEYWVVTVRHGKYRLPIGRIWKLTETYCYISLFDYCNVVSGFKSRDAAAAAMIETYKDEDFRER